MLNKLRHTTHTLLVAAANKQENNYPSEWEKLLGGLLGPAGYERLAWHSLRAIHLVLFAGRRFRRQVVGIHASSVATGIGNVVGNKVRVCEWVHVHVAAGGGGEPVDAV